MNADEFEAFRQQMVSDCKAIYKNRAAKYATQGNVFADFRASAVGGVTAEQAAYIHLGKHYRAVGSIVAQMAEGKNPDPPADGDILNNIRDAINYLILLGGLITEDLPIEGSDG